MYQLRPKQKLPENSNYVNQSFIFMGSSSVRHKDRRFNQRLN